MKETTHMPPENGESEYRKTVLRKPMQLIEFIKNKPEHISVVRVGSSTSELDVPICDKDVMCMKVIEMIKEEYGDHTMGETLEMLMDTIWWLQTLLIMFPGSETE